MPAGPRPMTKAQIAAMEKCRRIYDLRANGITSWDEIGAATGYEGATCEKYYRQSLKKYGWPALDVAKDSTSLIARDPQAAGKFAADAVMGSVDGDDKFREMREAMKAAGLHPQMIAGFIKRLRTNLAPVMDEAKRFTLKELTEEIERKISMTMSYMDHFSMSQASYKDLSIGLSVLIEKDQLLKNQPTMIVDFNSRQKLNVLMPRLLAEANRRGLTIDSTATRVDESR